MKNYDLTYLISPDLSEQEAEDFLKRINLLVQEEGGKIEKSEGFLKKKLKYQIKGKDKAYLVNTKFNLESGKVESLNKRLKEQPRLLRFLILGKQKKAPKTELKKIKPKTKIKKEKKVELDKINEKLEEILGEI